MTTDPEAYYFEQTAFVPNSKLPVLVYRDVLPQPYSEEATQNFLERNQWLKGGTWGAVPTHHFHPNTHECYAVIQGSSTLLLGVGPNEDVGEGQEVIVKAGDVIILPAGVSHCSKDFQDGYRYVGVYPKGSPKWKNEYCKDESRCQELRKEAEGICNPIWDPVRGHMGPLYSSGCRPLPSSVISRLVGAGSPNFVAIVTLCAFVGIGTGDNQPVDSAILLEFIPICLENKGVDQEGSSLDTTYRNYARYLAIYGIPASRYSWWLPCRSEGYRPEGYWNDYVPWHSYFPVPLHSYHLGFVFLVLPYETKGRAATWMEQYPH